MSERTARQLATGSSPATSRQSGSDSGRGLPAARASTTSNPAMTWPATSTAHQPLHGEGESHRSEAVATRTASKPSSARTKPSGTITTAHPPQRVNRRAISTLIIAYVFADHFSSMSAAATPKRRPWPAEARTTSRVSRPGITLIRAATPAKASTAVIMPEMLRHLPERVRSLNHPAQPAGPTARQRLPDSGRTCRHVSGSPSGIGDRRSPVPPRPGVARVRGPVRRPIRRETAVPRAHGKRRSGRRRTPSGPHSF